MILSENKKKILKGIEKVRDIIINTYGPHGRTWILGNIDNYYINDDGYKIIKELNFDDKYENLGLKLVLDMVTKTEEEAHDCTTLVTLLATSFIHEIYKSNQEIIPQIFIKKWNMYINDIINMLYKTCNYNIDKETLKSIAKICVKEKELGDIIGETIYKLGSKGHLITKISDNDNTYVEYKKGYVLEDFYDGEQIIKGKSHEWNNVRVLIINDTLDSLFPLINIIKELKEKKEKLLLICLNYYDDVLEDLKKFTKEEIYILPYKLKGYKNMQLNTIADLEMILGAETYNKNDLYNVKLTNLKVIEGLEITKEKIYLHYEKVSCIHKGISQEREAKLLGLSACIYVGGSTLNVKKERLSRIEDSKYSCFNSLKYGYVLGGGKALFNIANLLNKEDDMGLLISNSLKYPFLTLLNNSGFQYNGNLSLNEEEGIDLDNHQIVSLKKKQIFDCIYGIERALLNASGLVYTIVHLYDAKID